MDQNKKKDLSKYWNSWTNDVALDYYSSHRNTTDEVYDSEYFFISRVLDVGMEILDVGCAAGGFSSIFNQMEPTIKYTGVDVSEPLIKEGSKKHPKSNFICAEGAHLPFTNNSFDLVFCSGVLHMTLNWREIVEECWRVTRDALIFDVRLIEKGKSIEDPNKSFQRVSFQDEWDGTSIVPYIILNIEDFRKDLKNLSPSPKTVSSYGYFNKISASAVTPYEEVCMSMWCLRKEKIDQDGNKWMIPIQKSID